MGKKIYLKYDDIRPIVECDCGIAFEMILLGFIYPLKKKDYYHFLIILLLQLSISALVFILTPAVIKFRLLLCLSILLMINILFAFNYNMIVIERLLKIGYYPMDYYSSDQLLKKGIYFKLQ